MLQALDDVEYAAARARGNLGLIIAQAGRCQLVLCDRISWHGTHAGDWSFQQRKFVLKELLEPLQWCSHLPALAG